jgi:hypothetical protein
MRRSRLPKRSPGLPGERDSEGSMFGWAGSSV